MALEAGINFFDTAESYSMGLSEEILEKGLGVNRKEVIISTKVRVQRGFKLNDSGLTRRHIIEACDASLVRLRTDYIDLYQAHHFDANTPLEETLRAFDDLVHQGKVRYIGCSNFMAWQLMKALGISERLNLAKFITLQAEYSLINRYLEYELLPVCLDQSIGILVWSPLSGGFLTGKYRRNKPLPKNSRLSDPNWNFSSYDLDKNYDVVEELDRIAKARNATISQIAINYLLRKPSITSVIIGVKTPEQLNENLKSSDFEISSEEIDRLQKMSELPPVYPTYLCENRQLKTPNRKQRS